MGVLLMLMTIGGLSVSVILLAISLVAKKPWLTKFTGGAVAIWFAFYAVMLFGFSVFSTEKTLALSEAKEYCGFYLDCHLHTSVTGVRTAKTLGEFTASGQFYIVKVKIFSDARRESLGLLTVDAHVVDGNGNEYPRDTNSEIEIGSQPPFEKRIAPAEFFEKEIVFDLPENIKEPRLDLREGYGIDHLIEALLIDDEDSLMHKRSYFKVSEQTEAVGVK